MGTRARKTLAHVTQPMRSMLVFVLMSSLLAATSAASVVFVTQHHDPALDELMVRGTILPSPLPDAMEQPPHTRESPEWQPRRLSNYPSFFHSLLCVFLIGLL